MTNDIQKADQIAFHFYTKLFYVLNEARATAEPRSSAKTDKWFNLETPDSDLFSREAREPFRSISLSPPPGPPPLEIQVLLSVPELTPNQALVYLAPDSSRVRIEPTPRFVLLESWVLSFALHQDDVDVAVPTIYKHGIPLFRSLYSLLRVLPAWKLYKRLKRRAGGLRNGHLGIQLRVRSSFDSDNDLGILRFHTPPSPSFSAPLPTQSEYFPGVPHPLGSLFLSATYLSTPNFQLDELESLLSSRFISLDLDAEEGFVPTLTKNQQRDSITGSSLPTSSGIRSSLARSPPKPISHLSRGSSGGSDSMSVAERFILPSRTVSLSAGSSGPPRISAPPLRPSTSNSNTPSLPPSGLAVSRLRKESFNSSPSSSLTRTGGADLPSAPSFPLPGGSSVSLSSSPASGPLPIRRPNINPVHPFKSNTLSSHSGSSPSLSIRQSALGGSPGVPSSLSRQITQQQQQTSVASGSRVPPSPIGGAFPFGANRPSPPTFAPSSLGDRRPGTSGSGGSAERDRRTSMTSLVGEGIDAERPPRKRYSSSFGHRYVGSVGSTGSAAVGAGSTGSGEALGSVGNADGMAMAPVSDIRERKESAAAVNSFLSTATDDDDISIFVQDIDARRPLTGRVKERERQDRDKEEQSKESEPGRGQSHDRHPTDGTDTTIRGAKANERAGSLRSDTQVTTGTPPSSPSSPSGSSPPPTRRTTSLASAATTAMVSSPLPAVARLSTSPTAAQMSTSPTRGGPMLTSQGEVEERLRKMNEAFLKSLEGISNSAGGSVRRTERERARLQREERSIASGSGSPVEGKRSSRDASSGGGSSTGDAGGARGSPSPFSREIGRRYHGSTSSLGNSEAVSQGSEEVIGRMDLDDGRRQGRYPP